VKSSVPVTTTSAFSPRSMDATPQLSSDSSESESDWARSRRESRAALIKLICETDPLLCRCGSRMRAVSVIREGAAVDRIFRHAQYGLGLFSHLPSRPPPVRSLEPDGDDSSRPDSRFQPRLVDNMTISAYISFMIHECLGQGSVHRQPVLPSPGASFSEGQAESREADAYVVSRIGR